MSEHPNVSRLRECYAAFGKGDLAVLDDLFADEIVWIEGGRNQLAGRYEGRPAVYEMFGRLMTLTEGTFRVDVRALFADDTDGVAVVTTSMRRGATTAEMVAADIYRFADGKVVEVQPVSGDQEAMDAVIG